MESMNCGILDNGVRDSVFGEVWFNGSYDSLDDNDKKANMQTK